MEAENKSRRAVPRIPTPTIMGQGEVRKFGSGKDCSPERALQLVEQREVGLQEEVYASGQSQTGGSVGVSYNPHGLVDFATNPFGMQLPCGLALAAPRTGSVIWYKNVLHPDCSMADFGDLEEKKPQLHQLGEDWLFRDEGNPVLSGSQTDSGHR